MYVTRKADYAIRCVLYLSKNPGRLVSVDEIALATLVPKSFLAKILQRLMKSGIAASARGVKGGFQLSKKPKDINLLEVVEAIQDISAANVCAVDKKSCRLSGSCAVHPVWVNIRQMVERELRKTTFAKLVNKNVVTGNKL